MIYNIIDIGSLLRTTHPARHHLGTIAIDTETCMKHELSNNMHGSWIIPRVRAARAICHVSYTRVMPHASVVVAGGVISILAPPHASREPCHHARARANLLSNLLWNYAWPYVAYCVGI
jgi:hypothetical protein